MEGIIALMIPITFLVVVGWTSKWLSDNRVRRELINANATAEIIERMFMRPVQDLDSSLKWGMVSIGVGLALTGIQLLDIDADDPLTFALIFIFAGAALILFYFMKANQDKDTGVI